jgi:hypothetical protein
MDMNSTLTAQKERVKGNEREGVRFSGLEVYVRIQTALELLAILERWRNDSPVDHLPLFKSIARQVAAHVELDSTLTALMPADELSSAPILERSEENPQCFRETHARLLKARQRLLPWLLLTTYRDHPPTAVEAWKFLKLDDVRGLLENIACLLRKSAGVDRAQFSWSFIRDQKEKLEFLFETLAEYGIEADSYAEAVQGYVRLVDSVFPLSARGGARPGEVVATVRAL